MLQDTWEMALIVIIVLASVAVSMLLLWFIAAVGRLIMQLMRGDHDEKPGKRIYNGGGKP